MIPGGTACAADEYDCTGDACDGAGACAHPLLDGNTICRSSTDLICDPMEACDGVNLDCPADVWAGTDVACATDGADCTADFCDGAGQCGHLPDHDACVSPALCVPGCTSDASGCVAPPTDLSLSCAPDLLELQSLDTTDCVLDAGVAGQLACLSCGAELGSTLLSYADFGDDTGGCDLDGWRLAEGLPALNCHDGLRDCAQGGALTDCCDELAAICVELNNNLVLRSDKGTNCGSKKEEWRLWRDFDFTGFEQVQVCAWVGHNLENDSQAIAFYAENLDPTGSGEQDQFMCSNHDVGDSFPLAVDVLEPRCAVLDAWANGSNRVRLTVVAHSENATRRVYLDNLSVRALRAGCTPADVRAYSSEFDQCEGDGISVIPDDWRGWTVDAGDTGSHPKCPGASCSNISGATVEVDDDWMRLERVVDVRDVDDEVQLCLTLADDGAGAASTVEAFVDAGSGWTSAFRYTGDLGADQFCRELCINLSDLDPAVARNPNLGLRIDVTAAGGKIYFQDIRIEGLEACAASADMNLTSLQDNGGGSYGFSATDAALASFDTDLVCSWGDPNGAAILLAVDSVSFRNPLPGWTHRRAIRFDNLDRAEALRDFPVPLLLDSTRVDYALCDGGDLRFLDEQLNPLAFEIETWDESGLSVVWVRVPAIAASSADSLIWMYYGNLGAEDGQDPAGVWDPAFVAVYHLAEDSGTTAIESSALNYEGTYVSGANPGHDGMFSDGAVQLDGTDDRVSLGYVDVPPAAADDGLTLEFVGWLDSNVTDPDSRLISKSDGNQDANHWWMLSTDDEDNGNYALRFRLKLDGTTRVRSSNERAITAEQWFYAVGTYDGSRMRMFVDGQELSFDSPELTGTVTQDAGKLATIGANFNGYKPFRGLAGEVRISRRARSPAWISAQQQAMLDEVADPFAIFGLEEAL